MNIFTLRDFIWRYNSVRTIIFTGAEITLVKRLKRKIIGNVYDIINTTKDLKIYWNI